MIVPISEAEDAYTALHLFAFPPPVITAIVFGCRMPESSRAKIEALLRTSGRYDHVTVHEAVIDHDHFAVNITPPLVSSASAV